MTILETSIHFLADGTKVTIRSAMPKDATGTLHLFRSIVEEGLHTGEWQFIW